MADGSGLSPRPALTTVHPVPENRAFRYCAFLSYGHKDELLAKWLHEALEKYRVPKALVGEVTANGVIPARLHPIFRDRRELAASGDLGALIRESLGSSRFLIVLCSPAAAASRWTNAEIDGFKKLRPDGCVLAAIVAGEPFASEMPGREAEECFPLALRHKYDKRGRPTKQRAEPIAADFRDHGDGRRLGLLKVVAGMLGVGLDDLVQRENARRQQRLRWIAAASIAGMGVTSTLSVMAFQARNEAREQRREAEGLVGFMLGDLRKKLEPLGRLDALDSVGAKALGYYEKQDKASLSDEALAQRSRALTLMGEIANTRGDLDGALERYREALASTTEQLRRDSNNPERLFDQAQNVFWVGQIDWQRGHTGEAANRFREYRSLADRMIAAAPDDPKYRLEGVYADTNLGTVLIDQRRFGEAATVYQRSLAANEALLAGDPKNAEYQKGLLENLAWLSEAQEKSGQLDEATHQRERELSLIAQWTVGGGDVELRKKGMIAHRALSRLLTNRGQIGAGIKELSGAIQTADALIATEPGNSVWQEMDASFQFDLAELQLLAGQSDAAAAASRSGCDTATRLIQKDRSVVAWNEGLRRTCATIRARLAFASGSTGEALSLAREAAAQPRTKSALTPDTKFALANARLLLGDIEQKSGEAQAAQRDWHTALAALPGGNSEAPLVLASRAALFKRLGDAAGANAIAARLDRIGYRHPAYLADMRQGERR